MAEKGITTVLDAITALEPMLGPETQPGIALDIIGEGPLRERIAQYIEAHEGSVELRLCDPVPYGPAFFKMVQGYHAMLLANRFEEQPRVIFDSFSQGVPVISSATQGVLDIVEPEQTALVFPRDDARAMAQQMLRFAMDRALQDRMARAALAAGSHKNHHQMHAERKAYFAQVFEGFS